MFVRLWLTSLYRFFSHSLRFYWPLCITISLPRRFIKINLSQWPTWCTIFNTFITVLYMYMFRAISCSSSGDQIVLIQHLVLSLSVSDRLVHRLRKSSFSTCALDGHLLTVTIPDAVLIQFDLLRSSFSTCAPDGQLLTVTIPDAVLIQFDLVRSSFSTCACGRSPAEIVDSNPTGGMDICLLWVSCVVR